MTWCTRPAISSSQVGHNIRESNVAQAISTMSIDLCGDDFADTDESPSLSYGIIYTSPSSSSPQEVRIAVPTMCKKVLCRRNTRKGIRHRKTGKLEIYKEVPSCLLMERIPLPSVQALLSRSHSLAGFYLRNRVDRSRRKKAPKESRGQSIMIDNMTRSFEYRMQMSLISLPQPWHLHQNGTAFAIRWC